MALRLLVFGSMRGIGWAVKRPCGCVRSAPHVEGSQGDGARKRAGARVFM